jgi:hypothetical protein
VLSERNEFWSTLSCCPHRIALIFGEVYIFYFFQNGDMTLQRRYCHSQLEKKNQTISGGKAFPQFNSLCGGGVVAVLAAASPIAYL